MDHSKALVLTVSALVSTMLAACAATNEEPVGTESTRIEAEGQWLFAEYCGTNRTGPCGSTPACPGGETPALGSACDLLGARCLAPKDATGARKKFVCEPRDNRVWAFNGYCGGGPGGKCSPSKDRPACREDAPAGKTCGAEATRCVKNDKIFACVAPSDGQTWVLAADCGARSNGYDPCKDEAPCPVAPVAGASCDAAIATCVSSGQNRRLYACIAR